MASYSTTLPTKRQTVWLPALLGIAVICMESRNSMGAGQTAIWLSELLRWSGHNSQGGVVELANHLLRKGGHFTGYGLLGLCFSRGWFALLRRRVAAGWTGLRFRAGACGVASALVVASCDEIHQIFLPTRGASVWDVMLDTSGALTLNLLFFAWIAYRRNALTSPEQAPLTTLGISLSAIPRRVGTPREMMREVSSRARRHNSTRGSGLARA